MPHETILIVDDSAEMVRFLKEYVLVPQGYRVIHASNGASGLEAAVRHHPDLIMLDMSMPRMTGMEMLNALRQTDCQAPVIFMTLHGSESIAVEAFRLGVRDYLAKPFTAEEAQQAVEQALAETRLAREKAELTRNLIAAETARQTVVTLSHYINNHLMVLSVGLTLIQETLKEESSRQAELATILHDCEASVTHISAVMRVLKSVTEVKPTTYYGRTQMIDIDAALREELDRQRVTSDGQPPPPSSA
jgi:DNA-binding response OmpR family regulator